jgi:hypothetical protein
MAEGSISKFSAASTWLLIYNSSFISQFSSGSSANWKRYVKNWPSRPLGQVGQAPPVSTHSVVRAMKTCRPLVALLSSWTKGFRRRHPTTFPHSSTKRFNSLITLYVFLVWMDGHSWCAFHSPYPHFPFPVMITTFLAYPQCSFHIMFVNVRRQPPAVGRYRWRYSLYSTCCNVPQGVRPQAYVLWSKWV